MAKKMMKGRMAPFAMPIGRQNADIPQMSFPHEK
jgi:hypothetical protein